jgi:hypothetical protein
VAPLRSSYEIKPIHLPVGIDARLSINATSLTTSIHTLDIKVQNVNSVGSYQYTLASSMLTTKTVTGGTMTHLIYKLFALTVTD